MAGTFWQPYYFILGRGGTVFFLGRDERGERHGVIPRGVLRAARGQHGRLCRCCGWCHETHEVSPAGACRVFLRGCKYVTYFYHGRFLNSKQVPGRHSFSEEDIDQFLFCMGGIATRSVAASALHSVDLAHVLPAKK